jgi:transcriptional regulator with XRE-family HTH domain
MHQEKCVMQKNTSTTYAIEHVAEALRSAREAKGLTQRALSSLTGVPQAHISKIEANTVDLRLSSLLALAHALDLELALVPRKAAPAVQSLARTAGTSFAAPQISKELARAGQALARIEEAFDTDEFKRLRERLAEITRMQSAITDSDAVRNFRKAIEGLSNSQETKALRKAWKHADALRNAIVHSIPLKETEQRPAYQLEDDDDA